MLTSSAERIADWTGRDGRCQARQHPEDARVTAMARWVLNVVKPVVVP
jgi:hypothetical protein